MEWKFFACFIGLSLCTELLICVPVLKIIKKVRSKNYDKGQVKVVANKIDVRHVGNLGDGGIDEPSVTAVYEWEYNNRKQKLYVADRGVSFGNHITYPYSDFPDTMEITVDKKTGKYQRQKAEMVTTKLTGFMMLVSFVVGYYLSILITEFNPFAN